MRDNKNGKYGMERIKRNVKGQVQFFLENAFRIGFLMIALLVFFLLINLYITNRIDPNRLEAEVLANRIMYSDIITYQDRATLRLYTGIVDIQKFNDATLNSNIDYLTKKHATANLTLINNQNGAWVTEACLNRAQYMNLKALAGSSAVGQGSATAYKKEYPITYFKDGEYYYGTIIMEIVIPNS